MTWPELAGSVPVMTLNAVDLPDPLGPIKPMTSPSSIEKETKFKANKAPE
jgi:hypothetical protein